MWNNIKQTLPSLAMRTRDEPVQAAKTLFNAILDRRLPQFFYTLINYIIYENVYRAASQPSPFQTSNHNGH
jgi:hypothetical protein